jgi:iron(III) transport system substrate-binding protein
MTRLPLRCASTHLAALAVAAAVLPASSTATFAQSDWQAEWKMTVAAAEKEGTVVLLIPPSNTQRDFLQTEWPKEFPNIKLSLTTLEAAAWMQRVKIERGTGKYLWDGALSGSVTSYAMKDAGFLDPIAPEFILPDVKDPKAWGGWPAVFFDKDHKYVLATQQFLKMPFYNAKLVAPEKVQRLGRKVFLDPELKGKIVWHDPLVPGSGESFAPVMRKLLGDDGLKIFVTQQVVFTANMMDLVDRMARGQYAIGMGPVMTRLLDRYRKAGVAFDIRPLGNTPEFAAYSNTGGSNLMVLKDRPHPNALKVFVNWVLSKPVATRLAAAMGQDTSRADVPSQVDPAQARVPGAAYYEPQREELEAELQASHAYIRKLRGK